MTTSLEATDRKCIECGDVSDDLSFDPCEACGSDCFEFVHTSMKPLGFPDDDEYHIAAGPWGRERWEYEAEEPA